MQRDGTAPAVDARPIRAQTAKQPDAGGGGGLAADDNNENTTITT